MEEVLLSIVDYEASPHEQTECEFGRKISDNVNMTEAEDGSKESGKEVDRETDKELVANDEKVMTEPTKGNDPAIEDDLKPSGDAANYDDAAKPIVEEQRKERRSQVDF